MVDDQIGLGGAMELLDASRGGESGSSHLDDLEALEQVADLHPDPGPSSGGCARSSAGRRPPAA